MSNRILFKVLLLMLFLLFPHGARAATVVEWDTLYSGGEWTKEHSPYLLNAQVWLPPEKTLTIHPGVVIMAASSTINFSRGFVLNGTVTIKGTRDEPVHLIKLSRANFYGSTTISNAIFDGTPVILGAGTSTINNSKFIRSTAQGAIEFGRGWIHIRDSEISGNTTGIFIHRDAFFYPMQGANVSITNSVFENNSLYDIRNDHSQVLAAKGNWWGRPEGPLPNKITATVEYVPFLITDPRLVKAPECCSNVLFVPGFKASRLYRDDDIFGGGTTTRRAWEPFTNNDVRSLFLDEDGKSVDSTITPRDVMSSAYGVKDIYKTFIAMMDGVVAEKKIVEWKPFVYDWRLSQEHTGELAAVSVENLAKTSRTGKVTVIAHSNGGLVAKALGRELEQKGKSEIIDKVVFVAVPQLGTPQAIAGLLHGNDEALGAGILLRSGVARTWGRNMLGAYGLLPSADLFSRITEPLITLGGIALTSYTALVDFLTGKSDGRVQPLEHDLESPAVLSSPHIAKAAGLHERIDTWRFPTMTEVISLVGWGTPTTRTIEYSSTSPRIRKSSDGDGTVITESARAQGEGGEESVAYFNQFLFNGDHDKNISHATILEALPVKNFISQILSTSTIRAVKNVLPSYLSWNKPESEEMSWITVSVHSPVDLHLYDDKGGHMGLVAPPGVTDPDIMMFEDTIGGQYDVIGDEKYYTVPAGGTYKAELQGTGMGGFTFQLQKFVGEDMTEVNNTVYADLPVTPLLDAHASFSSLSLVPELYLDVDGDGGVDITTQPNPHLDPLIHLESFKKIVKGLGIESSLEKKIINRIEKLEKEIQKGKGTVYIEKLKKFSSLIKNGHWKKKTLGVEDRQALISFLETLISTLESN